MVTVIGTPTLDGHNNSFTLFVKQEDKGLENRAMDSISNKFISKTKQFEARSCALSLFMPQVPLVKLVRSL